MGQAMQGRGVLECWLVGRSEGLVPAKWRKLHWHPSGEWKNVFSPQA